MNYILIITVNQIITHIINHPYVWLNSRSSFRCFITTGKQLSESRAVGVPILIINSNHSISKNVITQSYQPSIL